MGFEIRHSGAIPDTKNRILWALWVLTESDGTKYASTQEIADNIGFCFGTPIRADSVRKEMKRINEQWETFAVDRQHGENILSGNKRQLWRLSTKTLSYPLTAFVLDDLLHRSRGYRISSQALRETQKYTETVLGFSHKDVSNRIQALIKAGYLEKIARDIGLCFNGTARYRSEATFIAKLAAIAPEYPKQGRTLPRSLTTLNHIISGE